MKKRLFLILAVFVISFLVFKIVTLITKGSGSGPRSLRQSSIAVEVDSVKTGSIKDIQQFTGSVFPYYQYIVAPKVSGRIIEIRKRIGDWIQRGEVIAKIDDAEYQQAVLEAEASLKIAQASMAEAESQFALAKQELERDKSLQKKGIASASELDASMTNYDAQQSRLKLAQAQVEQREAALKSAEIRLDYTVLVATEPGFAGERFVDEGSLLTPNSPVISVLGIDNLIIRTTIIEKDYGRIQIGQNTEVEVDAFPNKYFKGTVARIAPMLQEASRMAQMEIEVVNDSLLLKPGMFARVNIVLAEKEKTQLVPSRSVVTRDGKKAIFLIDQENKKAIFSLVEIGIVTPEKTEILAPQISGLVVTLGHHLLVDGTPVIIPSLADGDDDKTSQNQKNQSKEER